MSEHSTRAPEAARAIIKAAKAGDSASVEALLARDSTLVHDRDTDGSTPLHCACWKGHHDLVALLLNAGADPNATNHNEHWGTTPLHAAAHANQAAIIRTLVAHGADLQARDAAGRTPLDHTTFHNARAAAREIQAHAK
jgi:ankyrin repeat protein